VIVVRAYRDRVAVITGAANGLGRALARELAARKCHLALIDIDSPGLLKVTEELAEPGLLVTQHCADIGSEQAVQRVAAEIGSAHGNVHLLINNAAISASAVFANTSAMDFERIMRVNFFGAVYGCRAFLPLLQKHAEGQILNVSSCFAWLGCPGKTAYASSKGALRGFSESLRLELAGGGVGVTLLYPGPLHTSLVRSGISDSEQRRKLEEQFLISRGLPLERVARRCLDSLLTNPGRIVIGFDYRVLDLLARLSPWLAGKTMGFGAARAGF
jgi:NAD(P)-dependent dehydrogenase (short-subunit alcohol dehydrogenase family)